MLPIVPSSAYMRKTRNFVSEVIERRILSEPQYRDDGTGLHVESLAYICCCWDGGEPIKSREQREMEVLGM